MRRAAAELLLALGGCKLCRWISIVVRYSARARQRSLSQDAARKTLRFEDVDGYRLTAFATNTVRGQLADLELRHRRRARCEDRIRIATDTGLRNLPLQGFDQNRIWCALVILATNLTAWTQMLAIAPEHPARRWEPKLIRLRPFTIPGTLARHGRRALLHIKDSAPWADLVVSGHHRLTQPAAPT